MASGWKGIAAGALGLAMFEVLVVNQGAADRAGGIFTGIAGGVRRFIAPEPLFGPVPSTTSPVTLQPAVATVPAYPAANSLNVPTATKGPI